jgi:hypothetical protein
VTLARAVRSKRAAVLLVCAVALCAEAALAASVACTATRTGARARVSISLDDLLDRDLLRLVRLGLRGKITLELRLSRRGLFFGRTVTRVEVEAALTWSPQADVLLLDGRPVADAGHLQLERLALEADAPKDAELEVEVSARLQVVTAQSLGDVARWIAGGEGTAGERSAFGSNLIGAVAEDLTRSAKGSCPVKARAAEP